MNMDLYYKIDKRICEFCNESNLDTVFSFGDFNLLRCSVCGLMFSDLQLKDKAVTEIFDKVYLDNLLKKAERSLSFFKKRIQIISNIVSSGKVLEIGFGAGLFLKLMKESGYDVYGIEISQSACEFVKKEYQIDKVYCGDLLDINLTNRFDIIAFWDCLQCIPQPIEHIKRACRLLSQDGILIIQVPNRSSSNINYAKFLHKLNTDLSRAFLHLPAALTLFSQKTLLNIATDLNLELVHQEQYFGTFRIRFRSIKSVIGDLIKNGYIIISRHRRENETLILYFKLKQ